MAARVEGPRNERFDGDVPKSLHGMIKMELHLTQCVAPKGFRRMIVIGKAGKKLYTFPNGFWESMGVCPAWLEEQVRPILFGEEGETKKSSSKKGRSRTKQIGSDDVDVMS